MYVILLFALTFVLILSYIFKSVLESKDTPIGSYKQKQCQLEQTSALGKRPYF